MASYTDQKIENAIKVALDAIQRRFDELTTEYAESYMDDDLREMLDKVYEFSELSLMEDNDDLMFTGFHYFFKYLNIKDKYNDLQDIGDVLERYFDGDTIIYIYDTLNEVAYEYERSIPAEVADKLATMATEKFGIDVDWLSVSYINNTLMAFELVADEDEVAELYAYYENEKYN